jgi:hypothetical protein
VHYHVETNTLICPIKRLAETYSGRFSLRYFLPETLPLCYWNLPFRTSTFLYKQFVYYKHLFGSNITSSANKSRIYLHIIAIFWGLRFQFLSVPPHSKTSLSTYDCAFYVTNQPSPLGYNRLPENLGIIWMLQSSHYRRKQMRFNPALYVQVICF